MVGHVGLLETLSSVPALPVILANDAKPFHQVGRNEEKSKRVLHVDIFSVTNQCQPNPCANGGTCGIAGNSVFCSCPPNFTGQRCETFAPGRKERREE